MDVLLASDAVELLYDFHIDANKIYDLKDRQKRFKKDKRKVKRFLKEIINSDECTIIYDKALEVYKYLDTNYDEDDLY